MTQWKITYYIGNTKHEETVDGDAAAFDLQVEIKANGWKLYKVQAL